MELSLSSDQTMLLETTRRYLDAECPVTEMRELTRWPDGLHRGWWRKGVELGWTSLLVAEDHGGGNVSGDGLSDLALIAHEFGRHVAPGPLLPANLAAAALSRHGSDTQRSEMLSGLLSGSCVAAWCGLRLDAGGRGLGSAFRAEASASGYVLHGSDTPVEAGTAADLLLVAASDGDGRQLLFAVPATTPGVQVTPLATIDAVRRYGTVRIESAHVGADALVGGADLAAAALTDLWSVALAVQLAETVGVAERTLEFTTAWAFERHSFGRPLASYQELKHRFADMRVWLEASHAATTEATRAIGSGSADAVELVSVAKSYVGDALTELVQDCVQIHGGIGVTWEHHIHLYLRRATLNRNLLGTPEQHRAWLTTLLEPVVP